jgi:uncharacterized protein (TIGR03118 family)
MLTAAIVGGALSAQWVLPGCNKADNAQPDGVSAQHPENFAKSTKVKAKKNFKVVNLVANTGAYGASRVDPLLVNAWGMSWNPTGVAWISATGTGVSTVYNNTGGQVRPAVNIPSPVTATGGLPTGQVFSPSTTDFLLPAPNNQPARFIFVGVDGVLSAWNGGAGNNAVRILNNSASAAYTGLAIGTYNNNTYLYAANFATGHIDVWNKNWGAVSMSFTDPNLPAGYSPFNVQAIDNMLYVTYALVGPTGRDVPGVGNGYVDIYSTGGTLIKRFVSGGQLNAPWGVAKVSHAFFEGHENDDEDKDDDSDDNDDMILIGNFGDGRINAYKANGKHHGELWLHSAPIVIDGLWAIMPPPATATSIPQNRLYFAAGPNNEMDGLFGYIEKR